MTYWPSKGTWSESGSSCQGPSPPCITALDDQCGFLHREPKPSPPGSQVSEWKHGLPDSPTSHSPPGTWSSSCSWWRSHSCCNCRPSHRTWNLRAEAGVRTMLFTHPPRQASLYIEALHAPRGDRPELGRGRWPSDSLYCTSSAARAKARVPTGSCRGAARGVLADPPPGPLWLPAPGAG